MYAIFVSFTYVRFHSFLSSGLIFLIIYYFLTQNPFKILYPCNSGVYLHSLFLWSEIFLALVTGILF